MNIERPRPQMDPVLGQKIQHILHDIRDEYLADHQHPWIIGFSGGKDSTLVTHLVFEMLMSLAPHERTREVHIVSNDTLVESPLVITHIASVQSEIDHAANAWRLPIQVVTTKPDDDATFWVNLIGRGYPPPNRSFRWCTDRMKIQPTSRYIRQQADVAGPGIFLLGGRPSQRAPPAGAVARVATGERL